MKLSPTSDTADVELPSLLSIHRDARGATFGGAALMMQYCTVRLRKIDKWNVSPLNIVREKRRHQGSTVERQVCDVRGIIYSPLCACVVICRG